MRGAREDVQGEGNSAACGSRSRVRIWEGAKLWWMGLVHFQNCCCAPCLSKVMKEGREILNKLKKYEGTI